MRFLGHVSVVVTVRKNNDREDTRGEFPRFRSLLKRCLHRIRTEIGQYDWIGVNFQCCLEELSKSREVVLSPLLQTFESKGEATGWEAILFAKNKEQPGWPFERLKRA